MPDRRSFLSRLLAATAAAIALPALYAISRFVRPPRSVPATIHVAEKLLPKKDEPPRIVRLGVKDVAVTRDEKGVVRALSLTCTHTGCGVEWRDATKQFHCPCHNGVFDMHGAVLSGPPRRALHHLQVEVEKRSIRITDDHA